MFRLIALFFLVRNSCTFVEAQTRGQSVSSILGEDVTLSCSPDPTHEFPSMLTDVDCKETYSIDWRKVDERVYISRCLTFYDTYNDYRNTVDYFGNKYNLRVSNVQQSDAGQYQCTTYDGALTETALTVQLNIKVPSCSANPQTIEVGDHVSLICSLQILRALQWIAPNGTVLASRSGETNQPVVFNFIAKEEHNFQTFTCEAISESGAYNPECEVTPLEYTFIDITPLESYVNQGDNVMFNCDARLGVRAPNRYNYTWLQDNNIVLQGLSMSSYIIHDVQFMDFTRVQCRASNDGREEMESSEAIVYVNSVTVTRNPEDDIKSHSYSEELTSAPGTTAIVGDNCDNCNNCAFSFSTLTKSLLATCVILLILSSCVNVALVVCLVKSRQAYSNAENSPTGGSQMTYTDLQLRDVTKAEYETCRVKSADNNDTYEAVDGEYEVPPTENMGNPEDTGLYELPKA